jgi:hypothetical protein
MRSPPSNPLSSSQLPSNPHSGTVAAAPTVHGQADGATGRGRARRHHVCKLVLCARQDRQVMEAVGGYPGRLQSCVLSTWLRSGWRLTRTRELSEPMPPGLPLAPAPAARITRRVRFDDPADPTLAGFLCSLPRKERGREIRNFIAVALRSRM